MLFEDRVRECEGHLRLANASWPNDCDLLISLLYKECLSDCINFVFAANEAMILGEGQVSRRLGFLFCRCVSLDRLRLRRLYIV